ncbi:MAG: Metalloprotease [Burkholderia sp.]|jgi:metalloprotease
MQKALLVTLLAAPLVLAGCGSMESLGSDQEVVAAAVQSCQKIDSKNRITHRYDSRMRIIRQGLPDQVGGQRLNYKVYENKDMNAFAMPNGCVRVYSALLDRLNNDEVRAVLGHEIGHVALRHSVQQYRTNNGVSLAIQGASAIGSLFGVSDSTGLLGDVAYSAISAQYSQRLETEADNYSVDLLLKEPDGRRKAEAMASALRKISTEGQGSTMLQKMFGDHPDTRDRIANVENRIAASQR